MTSSTRKACRSLWVGAALGLAIGTLAILSSRFGHRSFVTALPIILAQPAKLFVPSAFVDYEVVLFFLVLALVYALLAWCMTRLTSLLIRGRGIGRYIAWALTTAVFIVYVFTFQQGRQCVRRQVTNDFTNGYAVVRSMYPDRVSPHPELDIHYCVPILPLIVACESEKMYGGFIGGGAGDLWFWNISEAAPFCRYTYWVH